MIESPNKVSSRYPTVPPLPFSSVVQRSCSNLSRSTATGGSPTPLQGYRLAVVAPPTRKDGVLAIPLSRTTTFDENGSSPCCIRRSAVSSKDPTYVPPESSTSRELFFERKYPPMPKLNSVYAEAKKAEYDGNIELAAELYLKAIKENDRVDSSIKDYAGILHMKGKTKAAIDFMESQDTKHKSSLGFRNLLGQLKAALERELSNEGSGLPRVIVVSIDQVKTKVVINYDSLRSIIPNCLKIIRLTFVNPTILDGLPQSLKVFVEFSSHSAARKAVMVSKHESVKCVWASENLADRDGALRRDTIQLVKGGPTVEVDFALSPSPCEQREWPGLIGDKKFQPQTPPKNPSSARGSVSPLPLSFSDERPTRIVTPSRPRSMALDLTEIYDGSTCASMDWCMNTPSPVRHMAGFF